MIFSSFLPTLAEMGNPLTHVVDHPIWQWHGWWFLTNHMVMMLLAAALMLAIFIPITRRYQSGEHVPSGTRNFFEAVMVYLRDDVARPVLGHHADRFMPYLWTLFFFILFMNLLGLLPLEPITGPIIRRVTGNPEAHAIYGTATANIYVVGVLALLSFFMIQYNGIRENGLGNYLKHFTAGAPLYVAPILVPVEILGMFIKPFALFIRLIANMTAGHVLLAVLISFPVMAYAGLERYGWGTAGAIGIGIPVVLAGVAVMCLEVFVAFLQAYIFTMLTALFIGQLVLHEGDEHTGPHHDEAHEIIGSGDLTDYAKLPKDARAAGTHMAAG